MVAEKLDEGDEFVGIGPDFQRGFQEFKIGKDVIRPFYPMNADDAGPGSGNGGVEGV